MDLVLETKHLMGSSGRCQIWAKHSIRIDDNDRSRVSSLAKENWNGVTKRRCLRQMGLHSSESGHHAGSDATTSQIFAEWTQVTSMRTVGFTFGLECLLGDTEIEENAINAITSDLEQLLNNLQLSFLTRQSEMSYPQWLSQQ